MLIVFLLSLVVIYSFIKYIWHELHFENSVKNLSTIKPWYPIIGNATFFMGKKLEDVLEEIMEIIVEHGSPLKAQIGPALFVMLDKPEDVKTVLMSSHFLDKPYVYDFLNSPLGIFTQRSADEWKPIRKTMNPMFNLKRVQSFLPIMNQKALNLVKELEGELLKSDFDMMEYATVCTLSSICAFSTMWQSVSHLYWIYQWSNLYADDQKHWPNFRQLASRIFEEQTNKIVAMNNNTPLNEDDPKNAHLPFSALYVDGNLTDAAIKQQIEILLIAGFETTAATMSFAILMLAMHSNIQEQVFNELRSIYDTQHEEITNEHIPKLDILDRVIKETMRLFPPGAIIGRTSTIDLSLSECIIPKGATIVLSILMMHRRRDIWGEDAESEYVWSLRQN